MTLIERVKDLTNALQDALEVIDSSECFLPEEMSAEENEHFDDLRARLKSAKDFLMAEQKEASK